MGHRDRRRQVNSAAGFAGSLSGSGTTPGTGVPQSASPNSDVDALPPVIEPLRLGVVGRVPRYLVVRTRHQRTLMTWLIGKFRHTSPTLTMLSSPACATKITSASGQAAMPANAPLGRGGTRFGIFLAFAARSGRPACSRRRIPRRHRPGVQLAPSGKVTSALVWSSPLTS